jgi:hypothetical protein
MSNKWQKHGLLYRAAGNTQQPNLASQAANQLSILIKEDVYRTLFSDWNADNRCLVGAIGVDIVKCEFIGEQSHPFDLVILAHG